jgi:penicillin-insensitive murein endopeptidase
MRKLGFNHYLHFRSPLSVAFALVVVVLAAGCGRFGAVDGNAPSPHAQIADLQTTVGEFTLSPTDGGITVNELQIGSHGLGEIQFSGTALIEAKSYNFDLKGDIGADGMAVLRPDDEAVPFRARVFCLDSNDPNAHACDQYFVDLYFMKTADKFLHVQLVRQSDFKPVETPAQTPVQTQPPAGAPVKPAQPPLRPQGQAKPPAALPAPATKPLTQTKTVTTAAPQQPKKVMPVPVQPTPQEETEDEDMPEPDGAYVGLPDTAKIKELFAKPSVAGPTAGAPTASGELAKLLATEPKARTQSNAVDQAIGTYGHGRLERASKLDLNAKTYIIPAAGLKRFFGAYVTIHAIEKVAAYVNQVIPNYKLRVDDIAQQKGGLIFTHGRRAHASHTNGLDADIGYIMDYSSTNIPLAVNGRSMSPHVRKGTQWSVFTNLKKSGLVSSVFVDPAVKKGFCAYARTLGPLEGDAAATLAMIRPWPSHQTHFHMRFVCTQFNPRCKNENVASRRIDCN